MYCFDRNAIYNLIITNDKQISFLTNCKHNGITTFCRCKFKNDPVIYLAENESGKIIAANSTFEEFNSVLKKAEKSIELFKKIKLICPLIADFLYLLPTSQDSLGMHFSSPGTFFRNITLDLSNSILELAIKGKISTFNDFLKKSISKSEHQKIYLIIEHASMSSDNFIHDISNVLNENKQIHAIFCFDDSNIPQEYKMNFEKNRYEEYIFGKAEFNCGGEEILKGENIRITSIVKKMYSESINYKDFKNKYMNSICNEIEINQNYLVLSKYICSFNIDKLSKVDIQLVIDFLINNANYIDKKMTVEEAFNGLIKLGFLTEDLEDGYFQIIDFNHFDTKKNNFFICSFLFYLKDENKLLKISYRLFKTFVLNFKSLKYFTDAIIVLHIEKVLNDKDLNFKDFFLVELAKKTFKEYDDWKQIYICLFNKKFYKYIPAYNDENNINYFFLMKLARSHETVEETIPNEIRKKIDICKNEDTKVLLYILLYDYYDTHNQKECNFLIEKLKLNNKIKESSYYKYLQLLLAEKEQDWFKMIDMFDKSINSLPPEEAFRATNTKFAFSIMRYIDGGEKNRYKQNYIFDIANTLVNFDFFTINDPFVLNNLLVYKYIFGKDLLQNFFIDYGKIFNKANVSTQMHHYWLNKSIFDSLIYKNLIYFDFNFFIKFQDEYGKESRINAFLYNYFVVSKYIGNKKELKRVKKIIDTNTNFKTYRNYLKYIEINKMSHNDVVNNINFLIKYGFMVHRTIDIKYLIKELDKEDSL